MLNKAQRLFMIVLAFLFWSAPFAQAWVAASGMPCQMASKPGLSAPHACCGGACDCVYEAQKSQVPYTVSDRLENAPVKHIHGREVLNATLPAEPVTATAPEESPPKAAPLYEIYSEYRL